MFKPKTALFAATLILMSLLAPSSILAEESGVVFSDAPSEVQITAGSSSIVDIKVANTGDSAKTFELDIETAVPVSASIIPGTVTLKKGESSAFKVSFLSSSTNTINRYPSKLKLRGEGVDVVKEFFIVILPTAEKKFEINNNYLVLLNRYENLKKRFEQVKGIGCVLVEAGDVNAVTPKAIVDSLGDLNDNLEKTRISIKENDFLTASIEEEKGRRMTDKVEADINSLKASQETCEDEKLRVSGYLTGGFIGTAIGVIVILVIIGLVVYNHYTRLPKVRKLIRAESHYLKPKTDSLPRNPNVTRVGRDFRYEFKKKR
ncbi:MAG TPA: hypothetical protein VJB06_03075 [archaeon]|nr:hypothetical protein [archaeon]